MENRLTLYSWIFFCIFKRFKSRTNHPCRLIGTTKPSWKVQDSGSRGPLFDTLHVLRRVVSSYKTLHVHCRVWRLPIIKDLQGKCQLATKHDMHVQAGDRTCNGLVARQIANIDITPPRSVSCTYHWYFNTKDAMPLCIACL